MRGQLLSAALLAAAVAGPASAQVGPYRGFVDTPLDTNRSNRIVYVPLAMDPFGRKPPTQGYDLAAASWSQVPLGSASVKPDLVRVKDTQFTLERMDVVPENGRRAVRVVVSQSPAPPAGMPAPDIRVLDAGGLGLTARPTVERTANGVRYTATVSSPLFGLDSALPGLPGTGGPVRQFSVLLDPAYEVKMPRYITRAPSFSGEDREYQHGVVRRRQPITDRVAGSRQERRR